MLRIKYLPLTSLLVKPKKLTVFYWMSLPHNHGMLGIIHWPVSLLIAMEPQTLIAQSPTPKLPNKPSSLTLVKEPLDYQKVTKSPILLNWKIKEPPSSLKLTSSMPPSVDLPPLKLLVNFHLPVSWPWLKMLNLTSLTKWLKTKSPHKEFSLFISLKKPQETMSITTSLPSEIMKNIFAAPTLPKTELLILSPLMMLNYGKLNSLISASEELNLPPRIMLSLIPPPITINSHKLWSPQCSPKKDLPKFALKVQMPKKPSPVPSYSLNYPTWLSNSRDKPPNTNLPPNNMPPLELMEKPQSSILKLVPLSIPSFSEDNSYPTIIPFSIKIKNRLPSPLSPLPTPILSKWTPPPDG